MKRVVLGTAAFVAAVAVWGVLLPPRRLPLSDSWRDGTVRGTLHVHSQRSDGRGTVDEIARAAARAGLAFVVVTDHGDGTRAPDPPAYHSGVLCLDAVEISTRQGHYIAVGLPQAPYPLGGEARDVVEDVRRLGGFGVVAHPDSPKDELRWSDWEQPDVDAIELINPDTSWRVHAFGGGVGPRLLLLRALLSYPTRPAESIAQLLTDVRPMRRRWSSLTQRRAVVAIAGADAHANLALRNTEPGDNRLYVPIPSYQSSFESLSVHVTPARPFAGDAGADAGSLLAGLRAGHVYVAVDGWASPAAFSFTATSGSATGSQGDSVPAGTPMTLHVRSNAPAGYTTTVWRGGEVVASGRPEREFDLPVDGSPAVYTAEVRRSSAVSEPGWVTSNPIYVRAAQSSNLPVSTAPPSVARVPGLSLFDGRTTAAWSYEQDATSVAVVDVARLVDGARVRLRYGLSGGARIGQYAAAAVELPKDGVAPFDGVAFRIRAEQPMRVSVQVRGERPGLRPERWERSVYVDTAEREYMVAFDDMRPVGPDVPARPPRNVLRALMFVVDTTNSRPGASGRIWIAEPALVRASR